MVGADIDKVDVVALHARDDRGEVFVALVVGLEHLFSKAGLVERFLGFVGEAFAVGGVVVEDGNILALVKFRDVIGADQALLIVAAGNARTRPEVALRDRRIGGSRSNLHDIAVGIGSDG